MNEMKERALKLFSYLSVHPVSKREAYEALNLKGDVSFCSACTVASMKSEGTQLGCRNCPMWGKWWTIRSTYSKRCTTDSDGITYYDEWVNAKNDESKLYFANLLRKNIELEWDDD